MYRSLFIVASCSTSSTTLTATEATHQSRVHSQTRSFRTSKIYDNATTGTTTQHRAQISEKMIAQQQHSKQNT